MSVNFSVVVPNYNGSALLPNFLNSILSCNYPNLEIILVDNSSTDDSIVVTKKLYPKIIIIKNSTNHGFGYAVNQGVKLARYDYVCVLNNDLILDQKWFTAMSSAIEQFPQTFCFCSLVRDTDSHTENIGFKFYSFGRAELLKTSSSNKYVWGAPATAVVYKKTLFDQLHGFDPHYFAYIEDVDLHFRANKLNLKTIQVPDAICTHLGGATAGKHTIFRSKLTLLNWLYFIHKNYSFIEILSNFPKIITERLRNFSYFVRCLVQYN